MGYWHLDEVRSALEAKGWRILAEQPGDGYRVSGTWEIQRSTRTPPLFIDCDGLDDLVCLPMDQSYGCGIRNHDLSLYFWKQRSRHLWREELREFISRLDLLEALLTKDE